MPFEEPLYNNSLNEAARRIERRFRTMADTAPAMLWVTDPSGYCTFLSRGWYDFTGQSKESGLGYGWADAVHPHDRAYAREVFQAVSARREVFHLDYRLRCHDGDYRWAIDAGRPWYSERGQYLGYIGSVIDIHDRKKAEEELRRINERLEGLVAERTSQVEALSKALILAEQRERRRFSQALHDDLQQTLFGLEMRAKLLSLGITEEQTALQPRIDDLRALVAEAVRLTRRLALELNPPVLRREGFAKALSWLADHMGQMYQLKVELHIADNIEIGKGDFYVLLIQLVRELLHNVVKHAGVDQVRVSARRQRECLNISVEDQGAGFDPRHAATFPAQHSHLGLFSIEERLRLFGGRLFIDAAPGAGTRVTMQIPLKGEGMPALY